jgi:tetratricopeptide (TPR) repeat protein
MLSWDQYREMAEQATSQGKFADAEAMWVAALGCVENGYHFSPLKSNLLITSLRGLAEVSCALRKFEQAEKLYARCLLVAESTYGPRHPEVIKTLAAIASTYYNQGKFAEAEPHCWRLLELCESKAHPDDEQVGLILGSLATLYHAQGDYKKAEPFYQKALAMRTKSLGAAHPEVVAMLSKYANLLGMTHREEEAEHLRECVKKYSTGEWQVPSKS